MVQDGAAHVSSYARIGTPDAVPPVEEVDRREWIAANLTAFRTLLEPLSDRAAANLGSGPLGPALRSAAGLLLGAEVGALLGYLSTRVLGQYELVLLDPLAPTRLLFVAPNLVDVGRSIAVDRTQLVRWVALHEVTHALQFGGVPWLREHMAGLIRELLASVEVSLDTARMFRVPSGGDARSIVAALRRGDLISLVTSPAQRELLERLQATMAVVEGHAEHVMDAVGRELLEDLDRLRTAFDRRRTARSAPARLLNRVLGLDLKLRQYVEGKRFCDAVVDAHGLEALNAVWSAPQALPTLAELARPEDWVRRVS
jgi:coenzyme F420 biosynthesis associated uncharacterized protein